jgi:excisionase family DNA binding protein
MVPSMMEERRTRMDEIFTVKEVAQKLKTSTRFVLNQIQAGKLPAVKVGKAYRIHATDLERYLSIPAKEAL